MSDFGSGSESGASSPRFVKWPPMKLSRKPKSIVWKYFTEKRRRPDEENPHSLYWMCVFCHTIYTNKHATRFGKHILNCVKSSEDARMAIKTSITSGLCKGSSESPKGLSFADYDTDTETDNDNNEDVDFNTEIVTITDVDTNDNGASSAVSLNLTSDENGVLSQCPTPESGGLYKFIESMSSNEQRQLNELFSRAVYSSGIPFQTIVQNKEWQIFFKRLRPSFKLPHRQLLAGTLLNNEYDRVQRAVDAKLEESTVLCLQCDGWSNRRNEAVINFIINTPEPVFYKTLETKLARQSADYVFEEMDQIIQKIGVDKFEAVITDNASAMIKCTSKIHEKYPHISAYTCASHSINLLVQDILKLKCVEEVTSNCLKIVKAISRSQILKAAFVNIQEKENKNNVLTLLFPVKTRWTSWRACMHNLKKTSYALKLLCFNDDTKDLLSPDLAALILNEEFWSKVEIIYDLIDIAVSWTVKLQDDRPCISSVFHAFWEIDKTIKEKLANPKIQSIFSEADLKKIEQILSVRKEKSLKPIHVTSYLLDPQYRGKFLSQDEDLIATQFIDTKIRQTFLNENDVLAALAELAYYKCRSDLFSKAFLKDSSKKIPALTWWKGFCSSTKLHRVAEKILSLPALTATTEKSFSIPSTEFT